MKTSKKSIQDKKPIKTLKKEAVFSYTIKKTKNTVILFQKETGFSYAMKMEVLDDTLRLTQFTLTQNMKLANLSSELDDAASLEIFVQALTFLFAHADQYGVEEILFMVPPKDADHLMGFKGFFDEIESISTREGDKTLFAVYNVWEMRGFLKVKAGTIQTKIKQELWQMQRENHYIKNFLQSHQRGVLLPLLTLQDENVSQPRDNVILFPQGRRK